MSENWDTYVCRVDEKPASILLDLDLMLEAPVPELPVMGYVSVVLRDPDERGFPREEEYGRLGALEDALESALSAGLAAVYAGRCASDGHFDLFYYLRSEAEWNEKVREAMSDFPDYSWTTGTQDDPEWASYTQFLFPDEYAMLGIQNRRVLRHLLEQGDDTAKSRPVSHWADMPDIDAAQEFAREASEQGFSVDPDFTPEPDPDEEFEGRAGAAEVRFSRPDVPDDIDETVIFLADLARLFGGVYRGWACPVVE